MRALRNPRPKQMDPISTTLCRRARAARAAGAYPGFDEPMSRFSLLGAGFTDPEISPADRPECRDRPTGEISGLGGIVGRVPSRGVVSDPVFGEARERGEGNPEKPPALSVRRATPDCSTSGSCRATAPPSSRRRI